MYADPTSDGSTSPGPGFFTWGKQADSIDGHQDAPAESQNASGGSSSDKEKITWMSRLWVKFLRRSKNLKPSDKPSTQPVNLAERFKNTFSRQGVRVHFVGAWYIRHTICIIYGINCPCLTQGYRVLDRDCQRSKSSGNSHIRSHMLFPSCIGPR